MYTTPGDDNNTQQKFVLSNLIIWPTLHLFHAMLGHSDNVMLQARYHHPHLYTEKFACDECQHAEFSGPSHESLAHGKHQHHMVL